MLTLKLIFVNFASDVSLNLTSGIKTTAGGSKKWCTAMSTVAIMKLDRVKITFKWFKQIKIPVK